MFHNTRKINKTRKPHRCGMCGTIIEKGSEATYSAGNCQGDFYTHHEHVECHVAGLGYAAMTKQWGEDYIFFQHECRSDLDQVWLKNHHPIVAGRLGLYEVEQDDE